MAERPNDPLERRLKATFEAERADLERRRAEASRTPCQQASSGSSGARSWLPLAAAAAVAVLVAIAGVVALGSRGGDDGAVDLDVAAQPTTIEPVPPSGPTATPVPADVAAQIPTPPPDVPPAANECGEPVPSGVYFVWGVSADDPDGGLVAHSTPGIEAPVTRVLPHNGVANATGGCVRTANDSAWFELATDNGNGERDWVNSRYLRLAEEACIAGGEVPVVDLEPFFHTVQVGDRLTTIAERYNVSVDAIIRANPQLDPNLIIAGERLLIPNGPFHVVVPGDTLGKIASDFGVSLEDLLAANAELDPSSLRIGDVIVIPIDATLLARLSDSPLAVWAVFDDPVTYFSLLNAARYQVDPAELVTHGACGAATANRTPVCLSGEIIVRSLVQSSPQWTGIGPLTAWRTAPAPEPAGSAFHEVALLTPDGESLSGFVDPAETTIAAGHCIFTGGHSLAAQPCTRVSGADRTAGLGTDQAGRIWGAGSGESGADHVHDISAESNDECTRLVVTLGENANTGERTAAVLPPVEVAQQLGSVSVRADGWNLQTSFQDPTRVDYLDGAGIGLLNVSFGYEFSVEFLHPNHEPHVRFFTDPARVVIDLFPSQAQVPSVELPYGERFVLRRPIQTDLTGPGVPAGQPIVVSGFGRPFEAAGRYRIWSVPADVDADAFLADPGEPLHEDFFPTSGWAEAWGTFDVTLPDLEPGSYIAVFGELPPTDEIGFYGVGQLFRVADAPTDEPGTWPEATLLPDVQLAPEF